MRRLIPGLTLLSGAVLIAVIACGGSSEPGGTDGTSTSTGSGGTTGATGSTGTTGTTGTGGDESIDIDMPGQGGKNGSSTDAGVDGNTFTGDGCVNGNTACTNCIDDDGDGLIDAFDPECSGPLDDDESTFATGIPGDNVDSCQDCFFDGDSGHGNDHCQYATECLYGMEPTGGGASDCFNCNVSDQCVDFCRPYTPNGCDCFGCCDVYDDDGQKHTVLLSPTCSTDKLDDPDACTECVPSTDCYNDCKPCEVCIGKPKPAEECDSGAGGAPGASGAGGAGGDGVPVPECEAGHTPCTEDMPCPETQFCLTGCCVARLR